MRALATKGRLRYWISCAAGSWAVLFAAPHTWWALGYPYGFPGGEASYYRFMSSTWRYWYDVAVIVLSALAFLVALELRRPSLPFARRQRLARAAAWTGCVALTLRGVAGLVVDGSADLIWWPAFLAGGLLFGSVAWLARAEQRQSCAAHSGRPGRATTDGIR